MSAEQVCLLSPSSDKVTNLHLTSSARALLPTALACWARKSCREERDFGGVVVESLEDGSALSS
eukprot:4372300-Amphidinium_carterae.1